MWLAQCLRTFIHNWHIFSYHWILLNEFCQLKMDAVSFSEMVAQARYVTWCNNPQDNPQLNRSCLVNLKKYKGKLAWTVLFSSHTLVLSYDASLSFFLVLCIVLMFLIALLFMLIVMLCVLLVVVWTSQGSFGFILKFVFHTYVAETSDSNVEGCHGIIWYQVFDSFKVSLWASEGWHISCQLPTKQPISTNSTTELSSGL